VTEAPDPAAPDTPDPAIAARLDEIIAAATGAYDDAADLDALRAAEQAHMGKRSPLGEVQRGLGGMDAGTRRAVGQLVNAARVALKDAADRRRAKLEAERDASLLEAERIDVTLPGRALPRGAVHPLARTADEVVDLFVGLGYRVAEGPEVETDWHNFQALNIPPGHPARSMQDTLYVTEPDGQVGRLVLRTHTSPVQVRTMLAGPPPVYVVVPGRVYRADTPDATHLPVFNQIELLAVDEGLTMGDLKGTLLAFARAYFGDDREIRLRPSYFPFTEPSAEVDVSCFTCDGRGTLDSGATCRTCRGEGWVEILGCGMVHPNVLAGVGYDPSKVSGFAAGLGIERLYMLRSGLADLRTMADNDLRWLNGA
jgi:phenylalanyl-tRNA synthetase alpha chain